VKEKQLNCRVDRKVIMQKLTAQGPETQSADLVAENIDKLKTFFPEAFTEGKINFDVLKQLLGGTVAEQEKKYGLNWRGKRRARQLALTPSTIHFGIVEKHQFAAIRVVDATGLTTSLGVTQSELIWNHRSA
jgi:hypothetical protein